MLWLGMGGIIIEQGLGVSQSGGLQLVQQAVQSFGGCGRNACGLHVLVIPHHDCLDSSMSS
jgi:hypothetical protein